MITHVKFITVPVQDQERALDFYTEKLGFTVITDQPFDGAQRWIELRVPGRKRASSSSRTTQTATASARSWTRSSRPPTWPRPTPS